ncbi:hypothetical protein TNCV_1956111 [Trichonephila clavipes]|nr:hypothetical protein TNCV_1956111 [Trichonephila clavipes]
MSENHHGEFSATSGRPSISPSSLRLTSRHFPDVIPASEKKNQIQLGSVICAPVKEIPQVSQMEFALGSGILAQALPTSYNQYSD